MEHITFTLPGVQLLQLLLGAVLPLVVGLVTTRVTRSGLKAVLLAALSVVTSILTELVAALQTGEAYDLGMALLLGFGTFLVAVATHYGLLKPTGASEAAQKVLRTAPEKTTVVVHEDGSIRYVDRVEPAHRADFGSPDGYQTYQPDVHTS